MSCTYLAHHELESVLIIIIIIIMHSVSHMHDPPRIKHVWSTDSASINEFLSVYQQQCEPMWFCSDWTKFTPTFVDMCRASVCCRLMSTSESLLHQFNDLPNCALMHPATAAEQADGIKLCWGASLPYTKFLGKFPVWWCCRCSRA